jgi:hypothetical protein
MTEFREDEIRDSFEALQNTKTNLLQRRSGLSKAQPRQILGIKDCYLRHLKLIDLSKSSKILVLTYLAILDLIQTQLVSDYYQ